MRKIRIDQITNPLPDRNVSPQVVRELADSMATIGLRHPIIVTHDMRLVAGRQRLAAAKLLGWSRIAATIIEGVDEADLATLDENLCRSEFSHLEYAEALHRRREIHERLHPDTVAGSPELMRRIRNDEEPSGPAFIDDMVRRTGKSRSKFERLLRIVEKIDPETRDLLRDTPAAHRLQDLLGLMEMPRESQRAIAQRLHDGEIKRVAQGRVAPAGSEHVGRRSKPKASYNSPRVGGLAGSDAAAGDDAAAQLLRARSSALQAAAAAACRDRGIDCEALGLAVDVDPEGRSSLRLALPAPTADANLLVALRVIGDLAAEIDRVHEIAADTDAQPAEWRQLASPADMKPVPADQAKAEWLDASRVQISRGGVALSQIPVQRAAKSGTFVKPTGNTKSVDTVAIINDLAQGCFRGCTGFGKCRHACYTIDGKPGTGCFATTNQFTIHGDIIDRFDITTNGWTNDIMALRVPRDGSFVLKADPAWGPLGRRMWREASESSDTSASVSLGLLQMWAQSNPQHLFFGISSNYFRPSDQMLRWLAALDNAWVLHSVSPWLDQKEQDSRFAAIARFLDFGVPTAISIVTSPDFAGNDAVAERALKLVAPEHIIEAPHQIGKQFKHLPLLHINPAGACGDHRYDRDGHLVHGEYTKSGKIRYFRTERGTTIPARGGAHPRCAGCRLLCGATALGFASTTTSLEAARRVATATAA